MGYRLRPSKPQKRGQNAATTPRGPVPPPSAQKRAARVPKSLPRHARTFHRTAFAAPQPAPILDQANRFNMVCAGRASAKTCLDSTGSSTPRFPASPRLGFRPATSCSARCGGSCSRASSPSPPSRSGVKLSAAAARSKCGVWILRRRQRQSVCARRHRRSQPGDGSRARPSVDGAANLAGYKVAAQFGVIFGEYSLIVLGGPAGRHGIPRTHVRVWVRSE